MEAAFPGSLPPERYIIYKKYIFSVFVNSLFLCEMSEYFHCQNIQSHQQIEFIRFRTLISTT